MVGTRAVKDMTVNLVNTGGGAKIWKCTAQNSKDKVTNYLNQPNFGKSQRFLTRKYCSITVGKFTMLKPMTTNVKSIHIVIEYTEKSRTLSHFKIGTSGEFVAQRCQMGT